MARQIGTGLGFVAAALAMLGAAAPAPAKDLVFGAGIPAKNPVISEAAVPYFAAVSKQSGGSMNWSVLAGGQVISMSAALDGLQDSLVDAAFITPVFQRSSLVNNNVLFDAQFFGDDPVQVTGATIETILFDCPECLAEYRKANGLYLGAGYSSTPFNLICKKPVKTLADIEGLKVRATGAETRLMSGLGAVPISIGPADMVQAIGRGVLDCACAPVAWLRAYQLVDVAKNVLTAPMGMASALALFVMNRKTWHGLSQKDRDIIWRNVPMASARAQLVAYEQTDKEVRKEAELKGVTFHPPGPDVLAAIKRNAEREAKLLPDLLKKRGAKDPARLLAAYRKNLEKWKPLAAEIGGDLDKYVAVFKREIYDRVDPGKL